jgi:cytoskeleton protein RodZ
MSEEHFMSETQVPGTPDQASDSAPAESAGALLRQARERVGLHIAALAVMIRVPVKKLEALETDRLDLLPDLAFARALASSVCRALKIEPAPVLERLPQTQTPRLWTQDASINVPFRGPGDVARESFWHQFPKPVIVGVFLLLLGALALVFFPDDEEDKTAVKQVSSELEQQAPLPLPLAAPVLVTAPAALPAASEAAAALPAVVVAPTPAPAPVRPPVAAETPRPEVVKPAPAAATGTAVLTLRTKSASWIEVTDAQGVAQLRRIVEPGENTNVAGALPLTVVVGRSDATEVWIRGKAFALEPVTSQNVARFEVK